MVEACQPLMGMGVGGVCETRASRGRSWPQGGIRGHRLLTKPDSCVLFPLCGGRAGLDVGQGATPPPTLIPQHRRAENSLDRSSEDAGAQTSGVSPFLVGGRNPAAQKCEWGPPERKEQAGQ